MEYKMQNIMFVKSLYECLLASNEFYTNGNNVRTTLSDNSKIPYIMKNPDMNVDALISLVFSYTNNFACESSFDVSSVHSLLTSSNDVESGDFSDINKEMLVFEKYQNKKYNILIAEDEFINFEVLKMLLQISLGIDCNIIHAQNGKEAIEMCENNHKIDIVLMDIRMPIMTGLEATRQIKKQFPELPIVAQTAYAGEKEKNIAENAGCNDFITKPIEKNTLKSILLKYLK